MEPDKVCEELVRIAKKYIILLEPFYGKEAKLTKKDKSKFMFWKEPAVPFSYSWDYHRIFSNLDVEEVSNNACPLGKEHAAPYYRLYEFSKN